MNTKNSKIYCTCLSYLIFINNFILIHPSLPWNMWRRFWRVSVSNLLFQVSEKVGNENRKEKKFFSWYEKNFADSAKPPRATLVPCERKEELTGKRKRSEWTFFLINVVGTFSFHFTQQRIHTLTWRRWLAVQNKAIYNIEVDYAFFSSFSIPPSSLSMKTTKACVLEPPLKQQREKERDLLLQILPPKSRNPLSAALFLIRRWIAFDFAIHCCLTFFCCCCGRGLNWINFAAAWSTVKHLRTWQKRKGYYMATSSGSNNQQPRPARGEKQAEKTTSGNKNVVDEHMKCQLSPIDHKFKFSMLSAASRDRGQSWAVNVTF